MNGSRVPWDEGHPPATWAEVTWPDWVPARVREQIESFWGPRSMRRPADYEQSALSAYNQASALGRLGWYRIGGASDVVFGRYVHAWNSIGRVITDDGTVHCCSGRPCDPPPPKWRGLCPPIGTMR